MILPLYLAMTAAEMVRCEALPPKCGWMACHFSPYGTALSNCPASLPAGSLLILNDRTPVCGHDPALICRQLVQLAEQLHPDGILLDFQRPDDPQTAAIAAAIVHALPCPVGVSAVYAKELDCAVFLPPPPLHQPLDTYIRPWKGRDIWLEAALGSQCITVTKEGSSFRDAPYRDEEDGFEDTHLCCRYRIRLTDDAASFTLLRTPAMLQKLLEQAAGLGITRAVGLYQELNGILPMQTKTPDD